MDNLREIVNVSPLRIDASWKLGYRQPPRPVALRQAGYEQDFDFDTLWYDLFYRMEKECLIAVGPPQLNLTEGLRMAGAKFTREGLPAVAMYVAMDRCSEWWIECPERIAVETLKFGGEFWQAGLILQPNHCDWFADLRVLFTLSKNNSLTWIVDWVKHHVNSCGAQGVLFYDNGSSDYTAEDLLEKIASVPGVVAAVVVNWPFLYGPQGGIPANVPWDSDFCQYGAFAHARWRFLERARCVINCDVDEIVVNQQGTNVFTLCEQSATGYLPFPGRWCYAQSPSSGEIRHRDHTLAPPEWWGCPLKWAAVPQRISPDAQWKVHEIGGVSPCITEGVFYWHCRSANNSWKGSRGPGNNPQGLVQTRELIELWGREHHAP